MQAVGYCRIGIAVVDMNLNKDNCRVGDCHRVRGILQAAGFSVWSLQREAEFFRSSEVTNVFIGVTSERLRPKPTLNPQPYQTMLGTKPRLSLPCRNT